MILDLSPLSSDKSKITKPQGCSRYRARVLSTKLRMLAVMLVTLGLLVGCTTTTGGRGADGTGPAPTPVPTGGTAQSGSAPGSPPKFSDCSRLLDLGGIAKDRRRKLTVECARLQVPLDYAKPTGATISIALLRIHYADQPQRIGSLLVNPGGPGGSGVNLAVSLAGSVSTDVLQHFDIVGFDPRGVGLSTPVKCLSTSQEDRLLALDTDVRTAAGLRAAKQLYADFAAACNATYGSAIARYDTVDTARDMDRIRAALGEATMNYLGFSYGTELGAVYAHLFPNSIRAAALDGAVDPKSDDLVSWTRVQTSGFEQAFDQFASDCVTKDPVVSSAIRVRPSMRSGTGPRPTRSRPVTAAIRVGRPRAWSSMACSRPCTAASSGRHSRQPCLRPATAMPEGCSLWPTSTRDATNPGSTPTCSTSISRSPATTWPTIRAIRPSRPWAVPGQSNTPCSVSGRPPVSLNASPGRSSAPPSLRRPPLGARPFSSWATCTTRRRRTPGR